MIADQSFRLTQITPYSSEIPNEAASPTDGKGASQLLFGGVRLRSPVWAPDGTATLAYLDLPSREKYHSIIYVADLVNGQAYALNLDPVLEFSIDSLRTVKGPISWNQ